MGGSKDEKDGETPEEVENAILKGLKYLETEARAARLSDLANIIRRVLRNYLRKLRG